MILILRLALILLEPLLIHAFAIPVVFQRSPTNASSLPPSKSIIQLGLGPRLSSEASIYFPNSPEFADYTERWSASTMSDFAVVVVPAIDRDVAETGSES